MGRGSPLPISIIVKKMKKKYNKPTIETLAICLAAGLCSPVGNGGGSAGQSGGGTSGGGGMGG